MRLQRSRSAFSLTSDDSPEKGPEDEGARAGGSLQEYASLKREAKATSLPSWKSVDRLDNSSNCFFTRFNKTANVNLLCKAFDGLKMSCLDFYAQYGIKILNV